MSSGLSMFGGVNECHKFWKSFSQCRLTAETPAQCLLHRADYLECISKDNYKLRLIEMAIEASKVVEARKNGDNPPAGGH